jgi:peptidoglycan/xylan/chitin deacetylase (PgdA/CDA1 family)
MAKKKNYNTNTSTFLGREIAFDADGHVAGNGIFDWYVRLCQGLYKLAVSVFGFRSLIKVLRKLNKRWDACWFYFPRETSTSLVALTFDDAPGKDRSLCHQVLDLLEAYDARATFFITSTYVDLNDKNKADARSIHTRGHELGNHMPEDKRYDDLDEVEFSSRLAETERCIQALMTSAFNDNDEEEDDSQQLLAKEKENIKKRVKWFRPPLARLSSSMLRVLRREGYQVALADVFANDVLFQDCEYLGEVVSQYVRPGSIIALHMPDQEFREKNVEETRRVLQVLKEKGLQATTLTELYSKTFSILNSSGHS